MRRGVGMDREGGVSRKHTYIEYGSNLNNKYFYNKRDYEQNKHHRTENVKEKVRHTQAITQKKVENHTEINPCKHSSFTSTDRKTARHKMS
jgi:hypothetical protein